MYEAIKYLSYMDWLRPLLTVAQNWYFGPSHTYRIPEQEGWSAAGIERLLRGKGVKTWGLDIVGSLIVLSVKLEQAGLVEIVLRSAGVAIENPAVKSAQKSQGQRRKPAASHDFIDDLGDRLDGWLGGRR